MRGAWKRKVKNRALPGLRFYPDGAAVIWATRSNATIGSFSFPCNYYGVLRVDEPVPKVHQTGVGELIHGTINHGTQLTNPAGRRTPTSYYGPKSGVSRAIRFFEQQTPVRVGVIGLGAGVTAAFGQPGDFFRFYEINPLDLSIANTWFTFLKDCPADH